MFSGLTPGEAGRLDSVMFDALMDNAMVHGSASGADSAAGDALEILTDLREQHPRFGKGTADFHLRDI